MAEYVREIADGRFMLEANDNHQGEFIVYDGWTKYLAFTAKEALLLHEFLCQYLAFFQAVQNQEEDK